MRRFWGGGLVLRGRGYNPFKAPAGLPLSRTPHFPQDTPSTSCCLFPFPCPGVFSSQHLQSGPKSCILQTRIIIRILYRFREGWWTSEWTEPKKHWGQCSFTAVNISTCSEYMPMGIYIWKCWYLQHSKRNIFIQMWPAISNIESSVAFVSNFSYYGIFELQF